MKESSRSFFIFDLNTRTETYGMSETRKRIFHEFIDRADILTGSGPGEFQQVFGPEDAELCMKELARSGKIVIDHSGAKPVRVFCSGGIQEVPVDEVKPVSTVGAGDAFNGALIHAVREKKDILECVRYASCISAYVISHEGHFILPG